MTADNLKQWIEPIILSAGPSTLPESVIDELAAELPELSDSGMSIIEMSHRSKEYTAVHQGTIDSLKRLCEVPEDFEILLLQGGATLQFSMIPMNLGAPKNPVGYIVAGSWGQKAYADASKIGQAYEVWSGEENSYTQMPTKEELNIEPHTRYIHLTSNETIGGIRVKEFYDINVPLVIDMSSDFLTRPIPWELVDVVYAGAQKNLGPAGLVVVFVRKSVIEQANKNIPSYLSYATHAKANSLANTPPVFSIWAAGKTLKWIEEKGGIPAMGEMAETRSAVIYDVIDSSNGFYHCPVSMNDRSLTNIVFTLSSEELEKNFLSLSEKENLLNLKGHRSVGGIRASIYNSMPDESVNSLAGFMTSFAAQNG